MFCSQLQSNGKSRLEKELSLDRWKVLLILLPHYFITERLAAE